MEKLGRDFSTFEVPCTINLEGHDLDWVQTQIEHWKTLGASSFYLDTMNSGLAGPDAHIKVAAEFRALFGD